VIGTDPSAGFEEVVEVHPSTFPGIIAVSSLSEATEAAEGCIPGLVLWSDGSRLEDGQVRAGIAWQTPEGAWHTKQIPLGRSKEVFDAELVGAVEALVLAHRLKDEGPVTVLLDSQPAIARLGHTSPGPGQALAQQAHEAARQLNQQGRTVTIQWVPGDKGIEGNEQADQAAKLAATKPMRRTQLEISLAHVKRACTDRARQQRTEWLNTALSERTIEAQRSYQAATGWKQDPTAAAAPKALARRYFQLKVGHAAIGVHLNRLQAQQTTACQWCQAPKETVYHLLFECRRWRKQRWTFYKALSKAGINAPATGEEAPQRRLSQNQRATQALLGMLTTTEIGYTRGDRPREADRIQRDNERGLDEVEEAERRGDG
jgi:ribonuclease HI